MPDEPTPNQPRTFLIVGGAELLTINGKPVAPAGRIPATVFGALVDRGDVLVAGAFTPDPDIIAALELEPPPTVHEVALGSYEREALINAQVILAAIHDATERGEANAGARAPTEARAYRDALADLRRLAA